MNDLHRIIQVQEQTFRIGREPTSKNFLDTCDPDGIPRYLRQLDYSIAIQNRAGDWLWSKIVPNWMPQWLRVVWILFFVTSPGAYMLWSIYR
jgi:hypothetical protein